MKPRVGKVFLVGAGPGDPDLITIRGKRLLREADVVVMDALVSAALVKNIRAKIIHAGKRGSIEASHGKENISQDAINVLLVKLGRAGKRVVRLKGGDPFVFGRGSEEVEALASAKIPYEIVPGVTSAIAAPAAAGIPITDRRFASQVTFVTGHGQAQTRGVDTKSPPVQWRKLPKDGTLVVLMGVASWSRIQRKLLEAGWLAKRPVAAIESATNVDQRVIRTTLGASANEFAKQVLRSPAVIVVGEVARLGEQPKKIVVTRPKEQGEELVRLLRQKEMQVISAPGIRVAPLGKKLKLKRRYYDWVLFLSSNAVRTFTPHADPLPSLRERRGERVSVRGVLAIGTETKKVAESYGWKVNIIPKVFTSAGVLRALGPVQGKNILIPRVQNAPRDLPNALRKRGAIVEEVVTYETKPERFSQSMRREILTGVDAVTFTSASTVGGFMNNFSAAERKRIFRAARAVSMGPQTTAALRLFGVRSIAQAKHATIPALVEALCS